jgi:hypothetical protein
MITSSQIVTKLDIVAFEETIEEELTDASFEIPVSIEALSLNKAEHFAYKR